MDFTRLFDILDYQQQRFPGKKIALASGTETWDTASVIAERDRISAGLVAQGLHRGDRVGIFAHCGSPKWNIADAAMLQIGLVPVPMHATARADEVGHIVRDSGMRACFVSNLEMLEKLAAAAPTLAQFFSFEKIDSKLARREIIHWETLRKEPTEKERGKIQLLRASIAEGDLATILYTSGSTGQPKGVLLSHANIVSNIKAVLAIVPVDNQMVALSFLPLSHIFERMVTFVYMAAGLEIWYSESVEDLPKQLRAVRPHFFTAVPRVLERMHERVLLRRERLGYFSRKIFDWALRLGERYPFAGVREMPLDYRLKLAVARLLVFRKIKAGLGGRVEGMVVGAAALQPRLGRLFSAIGIEVREGYGLTETSPVVAFNRFEPGGVHFGTVGIPVPGVAVRVAEPNEVGEGEIEVFGPNLMLGYLNLPEETAARFTPDGWLRTGDLGKIEFKRFLKITGRVGEVFKTSSGKFVAPQFVEQQLAWSPFVDQCCVFGLNRPHVGALIVPNFALLESWCRENRVHWTAPQFMVLNPKVEKFFREEIERINVERLGTIEKVRGFKLLYEPWTPENGLLTPTLKLRRAAILEKFGAEVEGLF